MQPFPQPSDAYNTISLFGPLVAEIVIFEIVDDGRTPEHRYSISSPTSLRHRRAKNINNKKKYKKKIKTNKQLTKINKKTLPQKVNVGKKLYNYGIRTRANITGNMTEVLNVSTALFLSPY